MATPRTIVEHAEQDPVSCDRPDALACLGAELLRRAEESQPALETAWEELMADWGIHGEPVGVKRLREMIQEDSGSPIGWCF